MNETRRKRYTLEEVRRIFADGGCRLISDEYKSNSSKLIYECECGNVSEISLSKFLMGKRCKKCAGNEKLNIEYAQKVFSERNCRLLSTEYTNIDSPLLYECSCGEVTATSLYVFRKNKNNCQKCAGNRKYTLEEVRQYFSSESCVLLSDEYKGNMYPLNYKCSCGNESIISFVEFRRGHRCMKCGTQKCVEKISGENHYNWNFDLTEEQRTIGRKHPKYYKWRTKVFERDNYTCCVCGKRGGELNAHHLENYSQNETLRYDVSNGVAICASEHKEFHKIYGRKNNTLAQFDAYKLWRRQQPGIHKEVVI